jgi:asparagine synthase (glutamine-hydrolysing)
MCGIAGWIAPNRAAEIEPTVRRMMGALARRGPDSEGFEAWPGAGLGHKRLAIIDLSPLGHQPMLSGDRSVGLVFNGCIYNFLELRHELEQLGHKFRSNCDTEVLLLGYQQWGIDELARRLRGMFAFAIWDAKSQTLSLVRDRLGVKPLVYAERGSEIAFASTIGALEQAMPCDKINPTAVLNYFEYGNVAGDECIFEGVRKLPPAAILEWKDGKSSERSYWTLPQWDDDSRIIFEEAVEETERLIVEATRLRLCADVPIAALLSGGVDSTLVCWALTHLNANVTAFTVGAKGDASDETSQAASTARQLGIPHQIVELPDEGSEMLQEMSAAFSEPFASASAQAMLRVSKAVKPLAKVLLTGDGGDDVFLGYPFLHAAWLGQQAAGRIPAFAASAMRAGARLLPPFGPMRRARNFIGYSTAGLSAYLGAGNRAEFYTRYRVSGERLHGVSSRHRDLRPSFDSARRLLSDALEHQQRLHFAGEFMPKVDGATMYHSLESRGPFLDQKIWEFAASLPPALRFRGGALKAVLRTIVAKRVSPEVGSRKKQGFTVPVERLLADKWSGDLDILTRPNELERQGWVRPGSLAAPISEARQRRWVPQQLWRLLLFEHWLRRTA